MYDSYLRDMISRYSYLGYNVFGVTKGGRCLGSGDAYKLFTEHSNSAGPGKDCLDEKGNFYL